MNKPCATCPFLEANRHKPTPTDFEFNETEWYSEENIKGVWEHMRQIPIQFLSCHTTDPDYYGKDGKPVYACVGAATMIYLHIKAYELAGNYNKYTLMVGADSAIPFKVLAAKALAFYTGKTDPEWGNMILPKQLDINLKVMRWPHGFKKLLRYLKNNMSNGKS
jgi:hypothetical protein